MSNNFLSEILHGKVDLAEGELPGDAKVVSVRGNPNEEWFWVYFTSKEFVDIDTDYEQIPEMTLWFGPRRKV